ncbi:MAG: cell division protein ZapA [Thermodesulfobacteriota bacterium]
MERLVKFVVLGQEFPLYTSAPEEDVQEILQLVRSQFEAFTQGRAAGLPANKVAVLASLNMADQYIRLRRDFEQYQERVNRWAAQVAAKVEEGLS